MLEFNEEMLIKRLGAMPASSRVIFAAACAERLAPAYRSFNERHCDADVIERAIEGLWSTPEPEATHELKAEIERIMMLTPQEDGFVGSWTQAATNAQNAGMAATYALRTKLSGDAQEAAWAARVAYEAVDNLAINEEEIEIAEPGAEASVISHPIVQAELSRQRADLEDLEELSPDTRQAVFDRIHARAKNDSHWISQER